MNIPEPILEQLDVKYEEDGHTISSAKLKKTPKQCLYCDKMVVKQTFITSANTNGQKIKCSGCGNYKHPHTGKYECNIWQINRLLEC